MICFADASTSLIRAHIFLLPLYIVSFFWSSIFLYNKHVYPIHAIEFSLSISPFLVHMFIACSLFFRAQIRCRVFIIVSNALSAYLGPGWREYYTREDEKNHRKFLRVNWKIKNLYWKFSSPGPAWHGIYLCVCVCVLIVVWVVTCMVRSNTFKFIPLWLDTQKHHSVTLQQKEEKKSNKLRTSKRIMFYLSYEIVCYSHTYRNPIFFVCVCLV